MAATARIVIAERWSVLRRGLVGVLQSNHTVVADGDDVSEIRAVIEHRPVDLVLLGDDPAVDLLTAVTGVRESLATVPIIVLCDDVDAASLRSLLRNGVRAVLSKKVDSGRLLDGIDRVLRGDRVIGQSYLPLLFGDEELEVVPSRPGQNDLLTARELDVLVNLATGSTNREIAEALLVGESTVKTHLGRIYTKLEVDDRYRAVRRALELGLLG